MFSRFKSNQTTHIQPASGAVTRQLDVKLADELNVRDFGAVGDGLTSDAAAVQACILAAQSVGKGVYFPDGLYLINNAVAYLSGRVFLRGSGRATLRGSLTYQDNSFQPAADTLSPLNTASPYFSATNLNFESNGVDYGLKLVTIERPYFMSTFSLDGCRFYGNKGLYAKQMVGFQLHNCEFNNVVAGARYESCTNGSHVNCRWQNQAESGVWITRASDQTTRFPGGENIKFTGCEWAVCTFGIVADQCAFLTLANCLLDYCGLPLFLSGAQYTKASDTFFGASGTAMARFSGVSGYISPGSGGVAVYGRPGGSLGGNYTTGFTAVNCEFINYLTGTGNPIVSIDGYYNGTYPRSAERIKFMGCVFYASTTHSAGTLLYIKSAAVVTVIGNHFLSYNQSTTLADAWRAEDCLSFIGHSNDFLQCRQSDVVVGSAYEKPIGGVYVQTAEPTVGVKPGDIWVQP